MRFLSSNRLRKKLEKLNLELHIDMDYFVNAIIKVFSFLAGRSFKKLAGKC